MAVCGETEERSRGKEARKAALPRMFADGTSAWRLWSLMKMGRIFSTYMKLADLTSLTIAGCFMP